MRCRNTCLLVLLTILFTSAAVSHSTGAPASDKLAYPSGGILKANSQGISVNDGSSLLEDAPNGNTGTANPAIDQGIMDSIKGLFTPSPWGPPYIQVDGRQIDMDAQPFIKDGAVWASYGALQKAFGVGEIKGVSPANVGGLPMVTVRSVCDALGYSLTYDASNKRVLISTSANNANGVFGTCSWEDGQYSGTQINGIPDGFGTLAWSDGTVYAGQFQSGIMTGQGTLTCPEGFTYTGAFLDGVFNGYGKWSDSYGVSYEGEWLNGKQNGYGTMTYADGAKWQGTFENGYRINGDWVH